MKCIARNKYAYRVLEDNNINIKKYARDTLFSRILLSNATLIFYIIESTVDSNDIANTMYIYICS